MCSVPARNPLKCSISERKTLEANAAMSERKTLSNQKKMIFLFKHYIDRLVANNNSLEFVDCNLTPLILLSIRFDRMLSN